MACVKPLLIKNPLFEKLSPLTRKKYIEVPCGYCLNCRVDKRNWYEDCAKYQLRDKRGYATFLTLTYSDFAMKKNGLYVTRKDGNLDMTPRYKDVQDFLKRLRIRFERSNLWNNSSIRKDFKYIAVSELGGEFGRPHYHLVLFGLDYKVCEKIYREEWRQGICDALPVQNGCVRYVLKYIEKETKGIKAKELYDDNNIERPRHRVSSGFSTALLQSQLDYIKKSNGYYKLWDNDSKDRPVSQYIKNKYRLFDEKATAKKYYKVQHWLDTQGLADLDYYDVIKRLRDVPYLTFGYSIKYLDDMRHLRAVKREDQLLNALRREGFPCFDALEDVKNSQIATFDRDILSEALDYQRLNRVS